MINILCDAVNASVWFFNFQFEFLSAIFFSAFKLLYLNY